MQSTPVVSDESFRPWMDYIDTRGSSTPGSKHRYRRSTRSIREVVVPWELPVLHDTDSRTRLVLQLLHAEGRTSLVISVYKTSDLQLLSEYTLEDGAPVLRRQYEAAYIETSLATEAVFCTVLTELGLPCNRVEHLRQAFEENKQEAMRLAREFCDISVFIDRHGVSL